MNLESFREYCLSKPATTEEMPFGPETLVFKVAGKMFALTGLESYPVTANLKCDPQRAIELREEYTSITPGYHMNKQHWNTVELESGLPLSLIEELIDHSYDLVVSGFSKKEREFYQSLTQ